MHIRMFAPAREARAEGRVARRGDLHGTACGHLMAYSHVPHDNPTRRITRARSRDVIRSRGACETLDASTTRTQRTHPQQNRLDVLVVIAVHRRCRWHRGTASCRLASRRRNGHFAY